MYLRRISLIYSIDNTFHITCIKIKTYIFCLHEVCPSGYYWINCSKKCAYPYYGVKCKERCECTEERCDFKTGCTEGNFRCNYFQYLKIKTVSYQEYH